MPRARGQRPQRTAHRAAARTSDAALRDPQQAVALGADRGAPISAHQKGGQGVAVPPAIDSQGTGGVPREAAPGTVSPSPTPSEQVGRKDTPEVRARILEALRVGATYRAACEYAGVSDDSLARWRAADAGFAEALKSACAQAYMRNLGIIQKAATKMWQAAAWWLERKFPEEWARRDRFEHTGPGGGPIPVQHDLSKLPADKLLALREILTTLEGPPVLTGGEGVRRN